MAGRRRITSLLLRLLLVGAIGVTATACPPPLPPAPTLPAGVGVSWLRDSGGSLTSGEYQPAWQRWSVLGGTVTGPEPGAVDVIPASFWSAWSGLVALLPDGTAKFPWNGFAGEGVTDVTSPNGIWTDHTVTGPAGSCVVTSTSGNHVEGIVPSPDGTRIAVVDRDAEWIGGPGPTRVRLIDLHPGCAVLASAAHSVSTGGRVADPAFVWAPDSSGVLYQVVTSSGPGRIARLDATAGSTPVVVLDEGAATVIPLGWSTAGRVLFSRRSVPAGSPVHLTSTLETIGFDGSGRRLFDTVSMRADVSGFAVSPAFHVGYFVPGTTTVVYGDAGETRVNAGGETVPWFRIRLYDDTTGGKGPLLATDPPFGWHDEWYGAVPNAELIERFVR